MLRVGDALAVAELVALEFARRKDFGKLLVAHGGKHSTNVRVAARSKRAPMLIGDREEALEIPVLRRTAADREKVDDLDEQGGLAAACVAHGFDQWAKAGQKTVVADP